MPSANRWFVVISIYYEKHGLQDGARGQVWEYLPQFNNFTYFQHLPNGIAGAGVTHFFYNGNVYIYYTQHANVGNDTHYNTVFTWFV